MLLAEEIYSKIEKKVKENLFFKKTTSVHKLKYIYIYIQNIYNFNHSSEAFIHSSSEILYPQVYRGVPKTKHTTFTQQPHTDHHAQIY